MPQVTWSAGRMPVYLAFAGALLAALVVQPAGARAVPAAAPPVLGCSWAPAGSTAGAPIAEVRDDEGEGVDEYEPAIVGTVLAPPNTRPNDQRALTPLAKITRDEVVRIALAALPDADRRLVDEVELEIEQGYVIWEVETVFRGNERGPDRHAEVVVDAGTGEVLLVECAADDD